MVMVCTLGFFAACSSDDDPTIWDTYKGGDYEVYATHFGSKGTESSLKQELSCFYSNLKINVSKVDDTKAKVVITGTNSTNSIVTFTASGAYIEQKGTDVQITGTATRTIKKTDGTEEKSDSKYPIKVVVDKNNKATLDLRIERSDGTISIAETIGIPEQPTFTKILNAWEINQENRFTMAWEAPEDCPLVLDKKPADVATEVSNFANSKLSYSNLAFTVDGKIMVLFSQYRRKLYKDYATYKVVSENKMMVYLNNDTILTSYEDEELAAQKEKVKGVLDNLKEGIPVNMRWSNNDKNLFLYIDKDYATTLANNTVLVSYIKDLDDRDIDGLGAVLKAIVANPEALKSTTKLEAGINFIQLPY